MDRAVMDANPSERYLQALKVNVWWIILFVVVAVGVVFAMESRQARVYESHVQIVLESQASGVVSTVNTLNLLLGSDDFLGQVISENDLNRSKTELRGNIHGERLAAPNGTAIVNIYVKDSQARGAKRSADMVAEQFVLETKRFVVEKVFIGNSSEELPGTLVKNKPVEPETLVEKINMLDEEIAALNEKLSRIENSEIDDRAKAIYFSALTPRISRFEDLRRSALREGTELGLTQIIAPASLPTAPINSKTPRTVLIAALAAIIFGCTIAIAREALR